MKNLEIRQFSWSNFHCGLLRLSGEISQINIKAGWHSAIRLFLCVKSMPKAAKKHSIKQIGKQHRAAHDRKRQNTMAYQRQAKRKYRTNSKAWRIIRDQQLDRQPLCEHCLDEGLTRSATVVDHIDGDSWNNEPANLASLCHSHHSIKTAKHDGGFGNKRKPQ